MMKREKATLRRAKALLLRKAGMTYEQIGEMMGCTRQNAHQLVTKALQEIRIKGEQDAEEIKLLELERLDTFFMGLWQNAKKGNVQALDRALKIMERRAKLLGLDAPSKIAPTSPDGEAPYKGMTERELDQRIAELQAKLGEDA